MSKDVHPAKRAEIYLARYLVRGERLSASQIRQVGVHVADTAYAILDLAALAEEGIAFEPSDDAMRAALELEGGHSIGHKRLA